MKVNPRNFACTRQSGNPATGQGNHEHGALNVYSGKTGRFNIESNRFHLQAERSAAQDKPHANDDQKGQNKTQVQAGTRDEAGEYGRSRDLRGLWPLGYRIAPRAIEDRADEED